MAGLVHEQSGATSGALEPTMPAASAFVVVCEGRILIVAVMQVVPWAARVADLGGVPGQLPALEVAGASLLSPSVTFRHTCCVEPPLGGLCVCARSSRRCAARSALVSASRLFSHLASAP